MREVMVTECIDRALHALVASSTNSTGRWICQQVSLSSALIIFMK
jgi:hypothetical protein